MSLDVPNVPLADQNTRMMYTLGQPTLEHLRLQPPLQEVLDLQRKHVIETHARLVQHANTDKSADESIAFEEPLGVLLIELEQLTSGTSDFGEGEADAPDLALVAETELASKLKTEQADEKHHRRDKAVNTPSTQHRDEPPRRASLAPYNCCGSSVRTSSQKNDLHTRFVVVSWCATAVREKKESVLHGKATLIIHAQSHGVLPWKRSDTGERLDEMSPRERL